MRRWARWAVPLLVVVVATATGLAVAVSRGGADRLTGTPPERLDKVVLLGDSYSAGNGAGGYVDSCFRTPDSAGRRYAAAVRAAVVDVACSGAVVADLTQPRGPTVPAQVDAVDRTADVVVLTMGGNDVGFGSLVLQCFLFRTGTDDRGCADGVSRARAELPRLRTDLTAALVEVRSRMRPDAVLVLRTYPLLAPDRPLVEPGGYDANRAVRALGSAGTRMQQEVVDAVRASGPGRERTYLDRSAATVFAGHELGARPAAGAKADPFFVGFGTKGARQAEVYHPNPAGWAAWGDSLTAFLAGKTP
ncbi:GDSL-like Lipase/Acylhydrolase family protein [Pedococcus dokdonensis]|uniref:GDSL-like Lipase/Acylhydrolase family protein n=1 Tax=Pedococcus dokdonensis TaxID=443156 RepID=A0A1H0T7E1_9MICO|nr:GDSL-type esterase/lipase family protein [Pedococcus dokdonensis]SDP49939.1 GDSL-like Lipase/Acylhydrolase family protein [Pedococcus dokdonensis]